MGLLFSRNTRKKSSEEILEEIQNNIQSAESERDHVLQRRNYLVGRLIIHSIIVYVISAAVFYFCFFPASLNDRIFYMIPLLIFPLLIALVTKFITWYYKREIKHNKDKLADLKAKKKKILEDVMNKETYKVAKELLEKYAPEQFKKSDVAEATKNLPATHGLQRSLPLEPKNPPLASSAPQQQLQVARVTALPQQQPPVGFSPVHQKPVAPMVLQRRQSSPQRTYPAEGVQVSPQRRLVRPIIPRERNLIDRLIETIVGDGPSNRYALICKNCASHNGMALREEFEYLAFRCAYCGFPNPSHKVRPVVSRPHSRSSSEERRKSIEGSKDKPEEVKEDDVKKTIEAEDIKVLKETENQSDGGSKEVSESPPISEAVTELESDSDENSSKPSDGIRPRKPLHLTD